ncbi:hypothetical protein WJX82_002631 [Trebouxia sp. C0006]
MVQRAPAQLAERDTTLKRRPETQMALARAQGKEPAGKGAASTTSTDPEFTRQLWENVTGISVSQAETTGLQSSNVAWHKRVCGHCTRCKKAVWEKLNTSCWRKRQPSECVFLPKVTGVYTEYNVRYVMYIGL